MLNEIKRLPSDLATGFGDAYLVFALRLPASTAADGFRA